MKHSRIVTGFRLLIVIAFISGPLLYAVHLKRQTRSFRVVEEGVLYRSGQMTLAGLERTLHDYNIRTVITLRDARNEGDQPPDVEEEKYCQKLGIRYVRITPHRWLRSEDGSSQADQNVARFVKIMSDPKNHPVLVHCFAGVHRSGTYSAIYRMEFQKWSNESALAELHALGYDNLFSERDILGYLQSYEPISSRK